MPSALRRAPMTARLLVQLAAIAVVVGVPFLLTQRMIAEVLVAMDWVTHTADSKTSVNEIYSAVRDADRAALWLVLKPGEASFRERLADAQSRIKSRIERLQRITAYSPDQQARVAQMEALTSARKAEIDRVLEYLDAGEVEMAREMMTNAAALGQLNAVGDEFLVEEERLFAERSKAAVDRRAEAVAITTAAAIVQLILLALLVAVSERQLRRRVNAEVQARTARQRSQQILQTVHEPIALLDRELHIELCNKAFQSLYAEDGQDLTGQPLSAIGGDAWQDRILIQKLYDVFYLGREIWDYELDQATPAAGQRTLLVNAWRMPITDTDEDAILLTANDITARRRVERQVQELNELLNKRIMEVSEANSELEAFSYSVSHDLRAPLRHVGAFSEKLQRELNLAPETKAAQHLRVIDESARRMSLLIDGLLVHSRLGRSPITPAPVAMSELVDDVRAVLAVETAGRSIEWRIEPLPTVAGDPAMLRLVWQNLLGNAVKYTARRTHAVIEIGVRHEPETREYVFTVADNGAGFDMAYAEKLFGVFQRLHSVEEFPGTGIGLANVRRIVGRHGGRVWANAEPGHGARFHFTLPDTPADRAAETSDV